MAATGRKVDGVARPPYAEARAAFDLGVIERSLAGDLGCGINPAIECCDRHASPGRIALRWEALDGHKESISFEQLRERSSRVAHVLTSLGIGRGDRVAALLPRTPDLLAVMLGIWRVGAIYSPMFTAFGAKAIQLRLEAAGASLLVTDPGNRTKLDEVDFPIRIAMTGGVPRAGDLNLAAEMAKAPTQFEPVLLRGDDPFLLMFTSGTTGPPKRVLVPIRALCCFIVYLREAVGLREGDVFWNMADPGWAYGLYYGAIGPLLLGQTTIMQEAGFSVANFYRMVGEEQVEVLVGAPTAFRMLRAAGAEAAAGVDHKLRAISSGGEPLNPEVYHWFRDTLEVSIGDHYGQTEGGMLVCNHHAYEQEVVPGSAGRAMPGIDVVVLDEAGQEVARGEPGILAVDRERSPLYWFQGYVDAPRGGRYHMTGDSARMDEHGTITMLGRSDDLITSAGYRIGPYDVESTLIEHPAVREAAVIGKPDAERTEIVKAFVVADPERLKSPGLAEELAAYVRRRLSAHAYPREIEFVDELPKTSSGKIQRFLLRERERQRERP